MTVVCPSNGPTDPSRRSLGVQRAAKKPLTMDPIGDINQHRRLRWSLTRTKHPRRSLPSAQKRATSVLLGVQRFCEKAVNQRRRRLWPPPARTRPTPATHRPSKVCIGVQRPTKKPLTMDPIGDINQPRRLRWPLTRTKRPRLSMPSPQKRATSVFFGVQRFCEKAINQRRRRPWPHLRVPGRRRRLIGLQRSARRRL